MEDGLKLELCVALIPTSATSTLLTSKATSLFNGHPAPIVQILNDVDSCLSIPPHLTLYQCALPLKDSVIKHACVALSDISSRVDKITCKDASLSCNSDEGSVEVKFSNKNFELRSLQAQVVTALNPLRQGLLREKNPASVPLSKLMTTNVNVQEFGWEETIGDFNPHVTLAWFPPDDAKEFLKKLPNLFTNHVANGYSFEKLGLYVMGPYGTCTQLLFSTPLGANVGLGPQLHYQVKQGREEKAEA